MGKILSRYPFMHPCIELAMSNSCSSGSAMAESDSNRVNHGLAALPLATAWQSPNGIESLGVDVVIACSCA
eukprot:SAG11_NODE_3264_length_2570_cov_1.938486_4_plen_71_part_00